MKSLLQPKKQKNDGLYLKGEKDTMTPIDSIRYYKSFYNRV
jgi:hypothetical protein